jgi:hypothetical protein
VWCQCGVTEWCQSAVVTAVARVVDFGVCVVAFVLVVVGVVAGVVAVVVAVVVADIAAATTVGVIVA